MLRTCHRAIPWLVFLATIAHVCATGLPNKDETDAIHAGFNTPAKEISPGLYQHSFEHNSEDGVKTSVSYLARAVKHLVHLANPEIGLVSLRCQDGNVVEVTVTNSSAPPSWNVASTSSNATILVGNEAIKCGVQGDEEAPSVLHRVVEQPELISEDNGIYVFSLFAESTHFSHAFEDLKYQYYRGKRDIASAKNELKKAIPSEEGGNTRSNGDPPHAAEPFASSSKKHGEEQSAPLTRHLTSFDFLTVLHGGNETTAHQSSGGRHLLSTYSCDHDDDCASGTFNYDWDYESSPNSCCSDWGTCWNFGNTPYKPTCNDCSADKACATCSYCLLCSGYNSCDSCVYGSDRPNKVKKVSGYECEECADDDDCFSGYECKGWPDRMTCQEGAALACYDSMPTKNTETKSGSKYIVTMTTVTVKDHDEYGLVFAETDGGHEYYAMTRSSGSWGAKINLPCLAYEPENTKVLVKAAVAEVSCGESFRFGIWEDDPDGNTGLADDPMGDRWFSTLDFLPSSKVKFDSGTSKVSFELECQGCNEFCTEANSLETAFTPNPESVVSKRLSEEIAVDQYLPVGVWNYDAETKMAKEEYKLEGGGLVMNCLDCHLTLSYADVYVEFSLDAFAGFKNFAILADSEVTFHISTLLTGSPSSQNKWEKPLFPKPFPIPFLSRGAPVSFLGATFELTVGLKAKVDITMEMSTSVEGSAEYTSDVVGTMQHGLVYDLETGTRFLGSADIKNKNIDWKNSINGQLGSKLAILPCLQAGIWGQAGKFADAHAYGEICAEIFAQTTLSHKSVGYETSPESDSDMTNALVKLDETLPSVFKTCDVSTSKHDTRLLVKVGFGGIKLGADAFAAISWGDTEPGPDDSKDEELRKNAYGPWSLVSLESSIPVASGCLCISACSMVNNTGNPALPSGSDDVVSSPPPPAPTSTDVSMPTEGVFVTGTISLIGMQMYEWTSAAELSFRTTVADSAGVWVNHVRIDSVATRQINRRRLLASYALDVEFVVYAASIEVGNQINDAITSDVQSGTFAVSARRNGLSAVSETTYVNEGTVTTSGSLPLRSSLVSILLAAMVISASSS
jgi:hypothetical protein